MGNDAGIDRDTVGDWLALVDGQWPWSSAQDWDVVGLQVGDPSWAVARVLVALDVTPAVVAEAAATPDTLVLAHHPLLFRPLARLTPDSAAGRTALAAATARVAVAAAHTNLDVATDGPGTSDPVVRTLDLQDVAPLVERDGPSRAKLVTFVPPEHRAGVVDALAGAGAGVIGDYTHCTFTSEGRGTFRPGPGATPTIGSVGRDEEVVEQRIEMVLDHRLVGAAVAALRDAHPYEEAAVDVFPLVAERVAGLGRTGRLPEPLAFGDLARRLRDDLPSPHLRAAGDPDRVVATVAVVGGAGDSMIDAALAAGVDCYVTGDLRHHVTLDATTAGMAVVDAGHHAVEHAAMGPWVRRLDELATAAGLGARIEASAVDTQPWIDLS